MYAQIAKLSTKTTRVFVVWTLDEAFCIGVPRILRTEDANGLGGVHFSPTAPPYRGHSYPLILIDIHGYP